MSYGGSQTFTFTPIAGYHAVVSVDGVSQGAITSYTFTNVTAAHTIAATFVENPTYTITAPDDMVSPGPNGSISPTGISTVLGGTGKLFTITADPGYHIVDVLVDGVSIGATTSYTFVNVQGNHTISATFAPDVVYNASIRIVILSRPDLRVRPFFMKISGPGPGGEQTRAGKTLSPSGSRAFKKSGQP